MTSVIIRKIITATVTTPITIKHTACDQSPSSGRSHMDICSSNSSYSSSGSHGSMADQEMATKASNSSSSSDRGYDIACSLMKGVAQ